jgi:pimeloyl-ACP methyl ester carboxylesterase
MTDDRLIDVPGAGLFVRAEGEGPPIVLLHAGIVDCRVWDPFVPLVAEDGFRVIRYDARGYGRSATDDVEYSNQVDLIAVLDDLDVERACLVGNSHGGMIAFDTAVEFPDRVAGVVLLGAHVSGHDVEPTPEEVTVEQRLDELEHAGDVEALAEYELEVWGSGVNQPADRLPAGLRDFLRPMIVAAEDPTRVRGRVIDLDPPAAKRLDAVTMPVLVVAGELDMSYVAETGAFLEAALPNARLVRLPDVAHMIAVEAPEETARLIVDFARSLGEYE